jgi:hypothetical protein
MENFINNSTSGAYNFPSHSVDPEIKKQKDWNVQYCQAIHSLYRNNLTGINYSDVDLFARYRAYGSGNQDKLQYMDWLGVTKKPTPTVPNQAASTSSPANQPSDFVRQGFMNINWEILSVAPNFKNVILGTFEDIEHEIFADGVDEKSSAEREQAKWDLWMEREMKDYMIAVEKAIGLKLQKAGYVPETVQELEMFNAMGGFKLKSEMSIEAALRFTAGISEMKEVKRKIFEDLFDLGVAVAKDYLCPQTQKVKVRYCDPALCVIPFVQQTEFDNMPFAGEYTFYTIAEIRSMNKPDGSPVFTQDELEDIARKSVNHYNNPAIINNWYIDQFGRYEYDTFRVCVLDCEFKSDDYKYTTERVNSKGEVVVHKDKFGKIRDRDNAKTHITKTLMVYKCKWIVGTEYAWDYGHQFDIPRPTPSDAKLSFHAYKMKSGSMVKRMIPLLDSIQLSWLKLQNAKAKAAPSGLAIEYGSLLNVSIGNQKLNPLEVLKIRNQTGDILYQATTHRTYMPSQTNYKPIQELAGGLGPQGREYLELISSDIEMIRQIIGINRIADASSPTSSQLVGVAEMSLQATSNTLKPMYSAYITIKERAFRNVALRIQLLVKFNKNYELGYVQALGKPMTNILKIGSEVNNAMFGIRIEALPTQEEKQTILTAAMESMRVGRQGIPLLGYSDYLAVFEFVNRGMLKMAKAYIAYKEQAMMDKIEQDKQAAIQAQGQQQQQLVAMQAEQEQKKLQMEMEKIKMENEQKRITLADQHKYKMAEIQLQMGLKVDADMSNKALDMQHEHDLMAKEQDKEMMMAALQQQQQLEQQAPVAP